MSNIVDYLFQNSEASTSTCTTDTESRSRIKDFYLLKVMVGIPYNPFSLVCKLLWLLRHGTREIDADIYSAELTGIWVSPQNAFFLLVSKHKSITAMYRDKVEGNI